MKKFLLIALFGISLCNVYSQEATDSLDKQAQFPGGLTALRLYLAENMVYPDEALELGITGKCYTKFVVSTTGNISNIVIVKGVPDCPECDAEVIRLLKAMPHWEPALKDGNPVVSYYSMPFTFNIVTRKSLRDERRAKRRNGDSEIKHSSNNQTK